MFVEDSVSLLYVYDLPSSQKSPWLPSGQTQMKPVPGELTHVAPIEQGLSLHAECSHKGPVYL